MPQVKAVPDGMHTVTPHLVCAGAADAIEFYKRAFGAVETLDALVVEDQAPGAGVGPEEDEAKIGILLQRRPPGLPPRLLSPQRHATGAEHGLDQG